MEELFSGLQSRIECVGWRSARVDHDAISLPYPHFCVSEPQGRQLAYDSFDYSHTFTYLLTKKLIVEKGGGGDRPSGSDQPPQT